jgi:DHA1 family bicyclomycin/chloramphenicol resistance-like MFS transporter
MSPSSPVGQPSAWVTIVVVGQIAFGMLAMTLCLPSMMDWPRLFDARQSSVQLTFSAFVASYGGMQVVWGPLADRIGRKPVLLIGLAIAFVGALIAVVAPSLPVLIVARVLQGAGSAAGMAVGRALVQDLFGPAERTRVMAWAGMTTGMCPPAATLLGGQLHVRWGWQSNFVLLAAITAALLVAAWRTLPADSAVRRALPGAGGGWTTVAAAYVQLARTPGFLAFACIAALASAAFYTYLGGGPIVLARYGVTPERIGWYIATPPMAFMVGNVMTIRLVRVMSDRRLMWLGQSLTIISLLIALALAAFGPPHPLALSLPLILFGLGHGLLMPPTLSGTVALVPALAGSAAAAAGLLQQLGGAVASYLVGLVPHQSSVNLVLLMLAWSILIFLCLALLRRLRQRLVARPAG